MNLSVILAIFRKDLISSVKKQEHIDHITNSGPFVYPL